MSNLDLKKIESDLTSSKGLLLERVELLGKDKKRESGPLPQDFEEQAVAMENDEVVDRLDKLERIEIQNINSALERIQKGVFGKCVSCGEQIQIKRLEVLPYASTCISCANEITD